MSKACLTMRTCVVGVANGWALVDTGSKHYDGEGERTAEYVLLERLRH
jgi:hypothetical protein